MRIVPVTLAAFALALAMGTAAAGGDLEEGRVDAGLDGKRVHVDESVGDVSANAVAETRDVDVGAKAPSCDLKSDHAPATACAGPEVAADADVPTFNVDVFVGLGSLEAAPAASGPTLASVAGGQAFFDYGTNAALVAAAAAGASALALYGAWRLLKLAGLAGVIPLYSHISDDHLLDDPNRARIADLVRAQPGISTKEIAEKLGLAWGTVTHHLAKLEKRRFVVSKKYGKYRRYFMNGATVDAELGAPAASEASRWKDAVAVLRVPQTADVARFIREHPGFTQKSVGEAMGVSSSTILWHVKRLEGVGLVNKVREGKVVRYFPAGKLAPQPVPLVVA